LLPTEEYLFIDFPLIYLLIDLLIFRKFYPFFIDFF